MIFTSLLFELILKTLFWGKDPIPSYFITFFALCKDDFYINKGDYINFLLVILINI